jgi:beta-lactamase class A
MKVPVYISDTVALYLHIFGGVFLLLTGMALGLLFHVDPIPSNDEVRQGANSSYTFINPLFDVEQNIHTPLRSEMLALEQSLKDYISAETDNGRIKNASVYYRDLNNGPWLSVNDKDVFTPASLLKVPFMIGIFRQAESDPSVLQKTIVHDTQIDVPAFNYENIPTDLTVGSTYTVSYLIEKMVTRSDNVAARLLQLNINNAAIEKVYQDLALPLPDFLDSHKSYLTAREYASFLRILYNATYLTPEYSEYALKLLSKSEFSKGLVAGLPPNVTVAHKFGVSTKDDGTLQLHDCGIVYQNDAPPYILCVMTSGDNYVEMASVISGITSLVHAAVTKPKE